MDRQAIELMWLKRDFRVEDHRPLWQASQAGPVVVLYVFEPGLWSMPEMDRSHFDFICQSLREVAARLASIGGRLAIRLGQFSRVLDAIHTSNPIRAIYSHEETGNGFTYDRDRRVASWCKRYGVAWNEFC